MSKNGTPATPAFVAPFSTATTQLQLVTPAQLDAVAPSFADPRIFELIAGLGKAPSRDYLRHVMFDTHDVTLWHVVPAGEQAPVALAAYSHYTGLNRIGVFTGDGFYDDLDLWNEVTAALVEHVFTWVDDATRVFVHMPLPVHEDFHVALMHQGFTLWNTSMLMRAPERTTYGLDRKVYDLYRQEIEDDDGLSS